MSKATVNHSWSEAFSPGGNGSWRRSSDTATTTREQRPDETERAELQVVMDGVMAQTTGRIRQELAFFLNVKYKVPLPEGAEEHFATEREQGVTVRGPIRQTTTTEDETSGEENFEIHSERSSGVGGRSAGSSGSMARPKKHYVPKFRR